MSTKHAAAAKALELALSTIGLLRTLGINYREVIDAQEAAERDGRDELNEAERQVFIDQMDDAVAKL